MERSGAQTGCKSQGLGPAWPRRLQLPSKHGQQPSRQQCSRAACCAAYRPPGRASHLSSGVPSSRRPSQHLRHTPQEGGGSGGRRPPRADSGRWRSGDGPWEPAGGTGSPWYRYLGTSWYPWAALVAAAGSIVCGVVGVVVWCLDQTKEGLMTTIRLEASGAMQQLRCELRTLTSELRAEMQDLRSHIKQTNSDIKVTMWCVTALACVVIMVRSKKPPSSPPPSAAAGTG